MLLVQLRSSNNGSFIGHSVALKFSEKRDLSGDDGEPASEFVPSELIAAVTDDGNVSFELPDPGRLGLEVDLEVVAPDGTSLEKRKLSTRDTDGTITVPVEPKAFLSITRNSDPAFGKSDKLRGRLIDSLGRQQLAGTQITIFGVSEGGSDAPEPLIVTKTDGSGYFFAKYPSHVYREAFAVIGIAGHAKVPVHLDPNGVFPERLILVVEVGDQPEGSASGAKPCACDEAVPRLPDAEDLTDASVTFTSDLGRCVDITKPNRTIEEFDFYSVVRTTEPAIKGTTVDESPSLNADVLSGLAAYLAPRAQQEVGAPMRGLRLTQKSLKRFLGEPALLLSEKAVKAEALKSSANTIAQTTLPFYKRVAGRTTLTAKNPIDWDDEPTFYQACTIAHGHILHFRQVWKADGYSLGDLLYSLPLAPCQQKQIAVLDWDRRDTAVRSESIQAREALQASLSRDRDVSEIAHAAIRESMRGGSTADTDSFSAGLGHAGSVGMDFGLMSLGAGLVGGLSFGNSEASSSAWQKASRKASYDNLQQLRDRTSQAASSVRSQRCTIVQAIGQSEGLNARTEVVTNHNHCHAITMEYFEVLRHFLVSQDLVDVQECLFIPLMMSEFDSEKTLRWRDALSKSLRNRALTGGFAALQRIDDEYEGSDFPTGAYADDPLESCEGYLRIRLRLTRPPDKDDGDYLSTAWAPLQLLLGADMSEFWETHLKEQKRRDQAFLDYLGQQIAEALIASLRFHFDVGGGVLLPAPLEATLIDNFHNDHPLYVSVRPTGPFSPFSRKSIAAVRIVGSVAANSGEMSFGKILEPRSKVVLDSGQLRYRTKHFQHDLFYSTHILNDLAKDDSVFIPTPLARTELRNPREDDKETSKLLLDHLNDHIEFYHRALWRLMDPQRRYMLLDGFTAPNSGGKSVASVVENRIIGIVGNSLVLPVARGNHLDPTFRQSAEDPIDLLEHYKPNAPVPPTRVSVPTRGVFAESVMGACNSCEKKDESRFWRFEESPCAEIPTPIQPLSTASRAVTPSNITAQPFPAPLIAMQNAPAAPEPTGANALLTLLATPNLFSNITGLTENQKNALSALQRAFQSSEFFGGQAAQLAAQAQSGAQNLALQERMTRDIDKVGNEIESAYARGAITGDQRSTLTEALLRTALGAGPNAPGEKLMDRPVVQGVVDSASSTNKGVKIQSGSESIEVTPSAQPADADFANIAAITDVLNWLDLVKFRPPSSVLNELSSRGMTVQYVEDGIGQLNADRYDVRVSKLPTVAGTVLTAEQLLEHIRLNVQDFVSSTYAVFQPWDTKIDTPRWQSVNPVGAVIDIDMFGPDDGAVVVSSAASNGWIFTTITNPGPLELGPGVHPVSGNRHFGFRYDDDGLRFFTRGIDRTSGLDIPELIAFSVGHRLWLSFQQRVANFVNANGGEAQILSAYSKRHDWSAVRLMFLANPSTQQET